MILVFFITVSKETTQLHFYFDLKCWYSLMETIKVTYHTHITHENGLSHPLMSNTGIVLKVFVHETHSINLKLGASLYALRGKCVGFCLHFLSLESIVLIFTYTHVVNGNYAWYCSAIIHRLIRIRITAQ